MAWMPAVRSPIAGCSRPCVPRCWTCRQSVRSARIPTSCRASTPRSRGSGSGRTCCSPRRSRSRWMTTSTSHASARAAGRPATSGSPTTCTTCATSVSTTATSRTAGRTRCSKRRCRMVRSRGSRRACGRTSTPVPTMCACSLSASRATSCRTSERWRPSWAHRKNAGMTTALPDRPPRRRGCRRRRSPSSSGSSTASRRRTRRCCCATATSLRKRSGSRTSWTALTRCSRSARASPRWRSGSRSTKVCWRSTIRSSTCCRTICPRRSPPTSRRCNFAIC